MDGWYINDVDEAVSELAVAVVLGVYLVLEAHHAGDTCAEDGNFES